MWWQREGMLEQWLRDFLRDALRRRGINTLLSDTSVDPFDLLTDPRNAGFSSLDMVQLASRFAVCLGLDKTGLSDLLLARRSAQGWCEVARRSLQINDEHIGFYSSGSTASPSLSRHSLRNLTAEAGFFVDQLSQLIPYQRVVSTVPCHHIYGFIWGMLLPQQSAAVENLFVDTSSCLPTSWAAQLCELDLIVATPDTWKLLVALQVPMPRRFVAVSSTAPLPESVALEFAAQHPHAVMVEIYGSTETGGLAWRTHISQAFHLLPRWQLQTDDTGTTAVCCHDQQHYSLQDNIELLPGGYIRLHGRRDSVIQIAGHNINTDTVARRLSSHPDIVSAKVMHRQHEGETQLHYFLVVQSEVTAAQPWCSAFTAWLSHELGDVPPPVSVVLASSLPASSLGKSIVWEPEHYPVLSGIYRGRLSH